MKKLLRNAGIALVGILGAAGATQAQPAAERGAPTIKLRYDDLDLAHPAGATAMLARIRGAAVKVCRASPFADSTDINSIERFDACRRQAVHRAVAQLDAPRVTAAFEAKSAGRKLARLP